MPRVLKLGARRFACASLGALALMLVVLAGGARAQTPAATAVPGRPGLLLGAYPLAPLGYAAEEFFISGQATAYRLDGRGVASPADTAPYKTRIVVVRPTEPAKFNGTVVVEWLNVSAGADGGPDWNTTHRELIRSGYAWVGVSAQKVGVEGGPSLNAVGAAPLKKADPARYATLSHPGDAFAYDIFSQAGRAVRAGAGVMGPLAVKRVLAAGESQSAVFLTTYVNAVDPVAKVYDGFLIHSRFGPGARIDGGSIIDASAGPLPQAVKFRPDLRVPVMTVLTETDVVGTRLPGYYAARVPDAEHLRVWEIAGAAHGDIYAVKVGFMDSGALPPEKLAALWAPSDNLLGLQLPKPMNAAPQHHYVVQAALVALDRWVRTGAAPAHGQRLELASVDPPALALDDRGIARGGVRTPWVDAPTARLSGVGAKEPILASLFGVTEPFDAARLEALYPGGKAEHLAKFQVSLDAAIKAGFILPADRAEILAVAAASYPGTH